MRGSLDLKNIADTTDRLRSRIFERFQESELTAVADDLRKIIALAEKRRRDLARPYIGIRFVNLLLFGGMAAFVAYCLKYVHFDAAPKDTLTLVQGVDSTISTIVFIGAAALFFARLEERLKRRRALAAIYELRVLAHVVDMHQLTKDPERSMRKGQDTPSSPKDRLTPFLLGRYLDYCSELLALVSKVAVYYAQDLRDDAILGAVDEIETLTNGLSRKIWQKIMILDRIIFDDAESAAPGAS